MKIGGSVLLTCAVLVLAIIVATALPLFVVERRMGAEAFARITMGACRRDVGIFVPFEHVQDGVLFFVPQVTGDMVISRIVIPPPLSPVSYAANHGGIFIPGTCLGRYRIMIDNHGAVRELGTVDL